MRARTELAVGLGLLVAAPLVATLWRDDVAAPSIRPAGDAPVQAVSGDAAAPAPLPEAVTSYQLHARLTPDEHRIEGTGTITFRNASRAPLHEIWVHLYLNAFADAETAFGRGAPEGFRGASAGAPGSIEVHRFFVREQEADVWTPSPTTPGDPHDATDIRLSLPQPIAPGDTVHIDVRFTSRLPAIQLRTGFAGDYNFAGQWFPKIAKLNADGSFAHFAFSRFSEFHADFGDYEVSVEAPTRFVVAGVGGEPTRTEAGGSTTHRFSQRGVHDFAFVAWNGFERRTRVTDAGVTILGYYPPGAEASMDVELEAAAAGLDLFSRWYGPYPYRALTIVHPPPEASESGGMEYPTLITTGAAGPELIATRASQLLTLHELAHQWFYGIVATNENAMPFLDEGLASYATGEASRALYGPNIDKLGLSVSVDAFERARGAVAAGRTPVGTPASGFVHGDDYGRLVYARGATVLRTFDRVYDGLATRAVARYTQRHRFGHPTLDDLCEAFREIGGDAPAALLREAITGPGTLDLRAERFVGNGVLVRRSGLAFPVAVDLVANDGSVERVAFPDGLSSAILRRSDGAPVVRCVVDPEGRVLVDRSLLDNVLEVDPPVSVGLFAQALVLAQVGASWVFRP